jgi:PilZ domain
MECSVCHLPEVVSLNAVDLKSFEERRCIARICNLCSAPSIWIEARPETQSTQTERGETEEQFLPARTDPRIKSRLVACIRHRGHDEEVVCENLSEGGVSFRSRTQYAEGSQVEIAVPFRPGTRAIFVRGRIVFSLPVRSAGLFRHGAAISRTCRKPSKRELFLASPNPRVARTPDRLRLLARQIVLPAI